MRHFFKLSQEQNRSGLKFENNVPRGHIMQVQRVHEIGASEREREEMLVVIVVDRWAFCV